MKFANFVYFCIYTRKSVTTFRNVWRRYRAQSAIEELRPTHTGRDSAMRRDFFCFEKSTNLLFAKFYWKVYNISTARLVYFSYLPMFSIVDNKDFEISKPCSYLRSCRTVLWWEHQGTEPNSWLQIFPVEKHLCKISQWSFTAKWDPAHDNAFFYINQLIKFACKYLPLRKIESWQKQT